MILDKVCFYSQEGTNKLLMKYICEDCGREMDYYYYSEHFIQKDEYKFYCEECYNKMKDEKMVIISDVIGKAKDYV